MESLTYLKNVKLSPKKLRMYLDSVKKLSPQDALDYLMYTTHKPGQFYYKAIHSAINNATQTLKVSANMLQFKLFTIEEGQAIRRFRAGSRGMVRPFKRRLAHIKIILVEKKSDKSTKVLKSEGAKEEVKKLPEKKETKVVKKEVKKTSKKEVTK